MWFRQILSQGQPRRTSPVRSRCRLLVEVLEQRLAPAMKGLSYYANEISEIQPSWYYNWGGTKPAELPANVQFVPMAWGYYVNANNSFVNSLNQDKAQPGVGEILGFNEPDVASQSNLTVAQALDGWQYMSALGIPVISPACANDTDSWMQQFMAGAAADGYRIDAVPIHWYGGDDPSGFIGYVDYVHSLYNKPVWITEFGPADWTGNHGVSAAQAYSFMSQVIPQLDARSYVQRYCWFSALPTDPDLGQDALFNSDGSLTALGQLYASFDVPRTDWTSAQVGNPPIPGSASFAPASGTWTVSGSGADIWNTSDQFTFVAASLTGNGSITAQVNSVQNADPWAKAGVMFRDSEAPDAAFADVVATPGNGVAFQWRPSLGGTPSQVNVTGLSAPIWTRLVRAGNTFSAFYSTDGATWMQLGTTQTIAMSSTAPVGLAVTSHNVNALATATFAHVSLLPSSWTADDIGSPGVPGSTFFYPTAGTWTVSGSGTDIWGTTDQFQFADEPFTGDGSITALVTSLQNTDPWAKAGVMFRDSDDPAAPFADIVATPGNGVAFQWRTTGGGTPSNVNVTGLTAPVWTRLVRTGSSFTGYYSTDGVTWTQLGTTQTINMRIAARAGLAVTSHNVSALTTAAFAHVSVLPLPWNAGDIGAPGLPGSTLFDAATNTWTVAGSGTDIWGTADQFQFPEQPFTGDGSIVAQVTSVQNTDPWTKAGVMFRASTDASAASAAVLATPGNGVTFQWRPTAGGTPANVNATGLTAPIWTRLVRTGNTFSGFYSSDGVTWKQLGSTQTIAMSSTALLGLAVTAHNNGLLTTATFANVQIPPASFSVVSGGGTAGTPFLLLVRAQYASGSTARSYVGSVQLSSSPATTTVLDSVSGQPLPGNIYTFTPADAGQHWFFITQKIAGLLALTVTDTSTNSLTGTSAPITVSASKATHLRLSAPPAVVTGSAFLITITALDAFNNFVAKYGGTVSFSSSDAKATVPTPTTLTGGLGTFSATLAAPGNQTITATDTATSAISGTSNTILARSLAVTSFTPTATGFVATFNKPFNPNTLNLYDAATANYGPADVRLQASSGPPVLGSLLLDPTDTTITFVKNSDFNGDNFDPSTGILAAGTYTATLRSAANGFVDSLGNLLDGAGSGNSGANYVTTFIVSPPPVIVGVPSFARGPGNTVDLPNTATGSAAGIPINLSNGANVTSGVFVLQYNSALLNITSVAVNASLTGATLTLDPTSTPGNAVLEFSSPTALPAGVIRLGSLQAVVPNATASVYKAKALLHFASEQLNGGAIAVTGDNAVQIVAYLGDVTGVGTLSGLDASLISRVGIVIDSGFAAYPMLDPIIVGDLTGNGAIDAPDVTLMNSFLAGTPRTQIPLIPTGLTITATGPDPVLSIPTGLMASAGSAVVVPVDIDTAKPVGSTGMTEAVLALQYDPKVFSVSAADVQLGSLTSGWQLQTAVNAQNGLIGIDLFSSTPIQTTAGGSLVTISLHVRDTAPAAATGIYIVTQVSPTGQRVFRTEAADALGALVLHMANTPAGEEPGTPALVTVNGQRQKVEDATIVGGELRTVNGNYNRSSSPSTIAALVQVFGDLDQLLVQDSLYAQPEAVLNSSTLDPLTTGVRDLALVLQSALANDQWNAVLAQPDELPRAGDQDDGQSFNPLRYPLRHGF